MGLGDTPEINLQENKHFQKLLESCNPQRCLDEDGVFLDFWGGIRDALRQIAEELTCIAAHSVVSSVLWA